MNQQMPQGLPQGQAQLMYPEEEYMAFAQLFIDLDPEFEDELEDDLVIEAYNKIKETAPDITMEQLAAIVPKMAQMMQEKMGGAQQEGQQEAQLKALGSVPGNIGV